jgi:hypothetical protein
MFNPAIMIHLTKDFGTDKEPVTNVTVTEQTDVFAFSIKSESAEDTIGVTFFCSKKQLAKILLDVESEIANILK